MSLQPAIVAKRGRLVGTIVEPQCMLKAAEETFSTIEAVCQFGRQMQPNRRQLNERPDAMRAVVPIERAS